MNIIVTGGPSEGSLDAIVNGEDFSFNDFVAVGFDDLTGKTTLIQNADVLTLGMACKMISALFLKGYNELDADLKLEIDTILGGTSI